MATVATRPRSVDRRLVRHVGAARRFLVASVVVGAGGTLAVVVQAVLMASVIATAVEHRPAPGALTGRLVALAGAFAVRAVLAWAGTVAAQQTSAAVASELRDRVIDETLRLGPTWLAGERAGELSLTATRGISSLETYFGRYLPQAVLAALAPLGILVWVGWEDWPSLLILLGLLVAVPPAMVHFGRRARRHAERQWRTLASLSARFLELIEGLPTLRAFGQEARGREEVATATERLRQTTLGTLGVAFLSALALELLAGLGTGLVAMVLGLRLLSGGVALSTALAVLLVSPEVFLPLRRAGAEFHAGAEGREAAVRILALVEDEPMASGRSGAPAGIGPQANQPTGRGTAGPTPIALHDVTVRYHGRPEPAIDHLTIRLDPGEHVAVLGPSGAGKSTLMALLLGFVVPTAGRLTMGDLDLADVDLADWRRRVSWVPQRPHLFRGTLAENLQLGEEGAQLDCTVTEVLEAIGLGDLAARLPQGRDTALGSGGMDLSAGERQLVAIGRAVVADAPLVLLDEPTAHLDREAAVRVTEGLRPWLVGRTVLATGHDHRLLGSTARSLDLGSTGS